MLKPHNTLWNLSKPYKTYQTVYITKSVFKYCFPFTAGSGFFRLCWLLLSSKKCYFVMMFFDWLFDCFGVPFWELLGCPNRPKTGQVELKTALESICFEKSECSRKALKTNRKSIKMPPRAVTKQPKIVPKRCQDDLEEVFFSIRFLQWFFIAFWSDLGVILGGFWEAFGGPNRSFWASIFRWILHVVPRSP